MRAAWLARLIAAAAACNGSPADPEPPAPAAVACADLTSARRVRRLSDVELAHVVSDLTGAAIPRPSTWAADPRVDGFDGDAESLIVHGPKLEGYVDATDVVATSLAAGCADAGCVDAFARSLGRRAFGRPLADDELRRLRDVYDVGVATEGHDAGLRLVAQAILLSPHFLYRTELGPVGAPSDADVELTPYELASELAFVFTGSRPDEDLLAAAERGELTDPAAVRAQAERLLATPGARDQVRRFFDAWLDLSRWSTVKKDPVLFPAFTPEVAAAMRDQAEKYVEDTVWNGSGALEDLLGAETAFVPPALAPIYGADLLQPPDANVRLKLDPAHRKGLLTLPAILAVHSPPGATSPVDRGMFVRVRLLCQDMGAPPLVANALPIDTLAPNATTREKFEKHGRDPACSPCHTLIDPPGFALERFDTLGRRRDTENGRPVDASGDLLGTDADGHFADAPDLVALLMKSQSVRACFVRQVFRFAEGRREQGTCETAALDQGARANGHRVQDILLEYASRPAFRIRGGAK